MKKILNKLNKTPLHPQWLLFRDEKQRFKDIAAIATGNVLDIGCSEQKLQNYLPSSCNYIGLDYPDTADALYKTKPSIYGDAQQLPFANNTFDTISFLEVLEHLPNPQVAVKECYRVLKPKGILIFSMLFLYPIHDAAFDFQRLTVYGIRQLFTSNKFHIKKEEAMGSPLMTSSLLVNIALVKTTLNGFKNKHPALLIILILPLLIPVLNLLGLLAEKLTPTDGFMAHGYTLHLSKGE